MGAGALQVLVPQALQLVPPTIPNPGINVGHCAITNLKLSTFVARHYAHTLRPMDNPVATLAPNNIRSFVGLKNAKDVYTEPDALPLLEKINRIRNHIKNIGSHLLKTLGMAKTPLSYVVRDDKTVPPSAQDPSLDYTTIQEEMVVQMPHTHITFREDNIRV
jgi:hypothetical protein